ncbi:MAG: aldehyde dehydrogenase family protein [Planctomycetes bacterium]|nr:aldehyde dehydrogenase family protein [Planctomycetota bacterium]
MELDGANRVQGRRSVCGSDTFTAHDPATGRPLPPLFHDATQAEVDAALAGATEAFRKLRRVAATARAAWLRAIAAELEACGEPLLARATAETGLPRARLEGERGRTCGQLRLFAGVVEEGSWVEARVEHALPERGPLPRPDLRRMLVPLGPVAVFGASNFPLAFSVAGGDTASALAAGCPVVVKAHPGHPGTSELVARAVLAAADRTGMPEGVFSLLHGRSHALGAALVQHPSTRAVAFTGSLAGGRALFDLAVARPEPIPVFAEMGSINPVLLLPGALAAGPEALAEALFESMMQGLGQLSTKPGLVLVEEGEAAERFIAREQARLIPRLEWIVPHYFTGRRVAFAGDPQMLAGFHELATELGMIVDFMAASARARDELPAVDDAHTITLYAPPESTLTRILADTTRDGLELLIGDSLAHNAVRSTKLLGLHFGFPCFQRHALFDSPFLGFNGWMWMLDAIANAIDLVHQRQHAPPER